MADPIKCIVGKIEADPDIDMDGDLRKMIEEYQLRFDGQSPDEIAMLAFNAWSDQTTSQLARQQAQLLAENRGMQRILEAPAGRKVDALLSITEGDFDGSFSKYGSIPASKLRELGVLTSIVNPIYERFASRMFRDGGIRGAGRNVPDMVALMRGLFNEKVKDPSLDEIRKLWREAEQYIVSAYEKYGVRVNYLPDRQGIVVHAGDIFKQRTLKQGHEATYKEWVSDILPRLDLTQMINKQTGAAYTEADILPVLDNIFRNIVTDGAHSLTPEGRSAPFWTQLDQSRFFVWKDYDSWSGYNQKYGFGNDYMNAMTSYIEQAARNIAVLEHLGPDPQRTKSFLEKVTKKASDGKEEAGDAWRHSYDIATGASNIPDKIWLSDLANITRGLARSALLGGTFKWQATIEAVTVSRAKSLNGLTKSHSRYGQMVLDFAAVVGKGSEAEKLKMATRLGIVLDVNRQATHKTRIREGALPWLSRQASLAADATQRLTGTRGLTAVQQANFGVEFVFNLTDAAGKSFAEMDKRLAATLQMYGIPEDAWVRATSGAKMQKVRGQNYLDLVAMAREGGANGEIAGRIIGMINTESNKRAVIMPNAITQRQRTGGSAPGSYWGELRRSMTEFMGYPMTYFQSVIMAGWKDPRLLGAADRTGHNLSWMAASVVAAWAGMALGEVITQGKDAPDITSGEALTKAFIMSGAGGIGADIIMRASNRHSGFFSAFGPTGAVAEGILLSAKDIAEGRSPARNIVQAAKTITPFQNVWYSALATNRLVWDNIEKEFDEKAQARFDRSRKKMLKEGRSTYYAPRGKGVERAPDLNIFREFTE